MEYLAGFYIVLGFLIIIFKSEFLQNNVYRPLISHFRNFGTSVKKVEIKPAFEPTKKLALQKVPVKALYKE